jgi:serine/threonine-protein kinase
MGLVYKGRDRHLNRWVALKFIRREEPALARCLLLEAQFMAGMDHPNIRRIHEVGLLDDLPCISMEFIQGQDLHTRAPGLTFTQRAGLVAQAARAAHAAHLQGLVHRDLKPRNIMVEDGPDGSLRAVVMDFGLARQVEGSTLSLGEGFAGTPFFLSPEQITGGSPLNARSDVYGLGATLYAVCTGIPPFAHGSSFASTPFPAQDDSRPLVALRAAPDPHALEALRRVLDGEPAPPRSLVPGFPPDLETIILACLERDPARRYESARHLAEDLERWLRGEPILARRAAPLDRLRRIYRKRRPLFHAAAAVLLALACAGGWGLGLSRRARRQAELAQRFGTEALQMAQYLRLTAMSPLHDRRGQMAWLALRLQEIQARTGSLGSLAAAPGAYAQGQGHLALDQPEKALECLNSAWSLGLRLPEVAGALAEAYLRLYQEGMERIDTRSPAIAQAQRDRLAARYRNPALAFLDLGRSAPGLEGYHDAVRAYLEEDDARTILLARRALGETPWMFEVLRFEAEAWEHRAQAAQNPVLRNQALDQVERCWQELTERAPSNPGHWAGLAKCRLARAGELRRDDPTAAEAMLARAGAACESGRKADPNSLQVYLARAELHQARSLLRGREDLRLGLPDAALAEECLLEARGLHPGGPGLLGALAGQQLLRADFARHLQQPTGFLLDRVRATLEEAAAASPGDPGILAMEVGLDAARALEREDLGLDSRPQRRIALERVERGIRDLGDTRLLERVHEESLLRLAQACLAQGDPGEAAVLVDRCLGRLAELLTQAAAPDDFSDLACDAVPLRLACAYLRREDPAPAAGRLRLVLDGFSRPGRTDWDLELAKGRLDLFVARSEEALNRDPGPALSRARAAFAALASRKPPKERPYGNLAHTAFIAMRFAQRRGRDSAALREEALAWADRALMCHPRHGAARTIRGAALIFRAEAGPAPRRGALAREGLGQLERGLREDPSLRPEMAPILLRAWALARGA